MATLTAALLQSIEKSTPRSKRKLQKHLRSSGLAYISRTGKLIPAKTVADELCQCPQKCDERVPLEVRDRLFAHFYGLGDTDLQNAFLRDHMDVRARMNLPEMTTSGRSPRRITCKYLVPVLPAGDTVDVCQKAFVSAFVITTKRVRLQREKLISSLGLNSYGPQRQKLAALMAENRRRRAEEEEEDDDDDVMVIEDEEENNEDAKRIKLPTQLEMVRNDRMNNNHQKTTEKSAGRKVGAASTKSCRRRFVDDPLIPIGLMVPDSVTIAPVTATADHDRDIAIVNNFFSNQLWKPEYILGTYS